MGSGCLYFIGMSVLWKFLACKRLHVCTVCIWCCERASFFVEVFLCAIYKILFIRSLELVEPAGNMPSFGAPSYGGRDARDFSRRGGRPYG